MSLISSIHWKLDHTFERQERLFQGEEVIQERRQRRELDVSESSLMRSPPSESLPRAEVAVLDNARRASTPLESGAEALDLDILILEAMFGRRLRSDLAVHEATQEPVSQVPPSSSNVALTVSEGVLSESSAARLNIQEREQTQVDLRARWTDADGQLRFGNLSVAMQRELSMEVSLDEQQLAKMLDPLVLNFSGPVTLSENRVNFDLTGDGTEESIATLSSKSFYLAFDKNNNGDIDSGAELFGALTNDGFAELAQYDEDGNGFIDERDGVLSDLQLFRPGDGQLMSLAAMGVEGIYLGNSASPFQLQSSEGELLGRVRQTGFFYTQGGLHSIQQIDLAV